MEAQWDPNKARLNLRKHGIRFADAVLVLEDDRGLTRAEEAPGGEERWVTLGMDPLGRVLVVVYTWRSGAPRLISARPATPAEHRQYSEGL
jgi:uncharacterized protein